MDKAEVEEVTNSRDKWKTKVDFVFGVAGGTIGLGNVWRFPYLCYKNGGGAFLIPYMIFLVGAAVPLFFLEVAIGQFSSSGISKAWSMFPLMKGMGYASLTILANLNTYYMVILAWSLRYTIASFENPLPWISCNNMWNSPNCVGFSNNNNLTSTNLTSNAMFATMQSVTQSDSNFSSVTNTSTIVTSATSPVMEFWQRGVLGISSGVHDLGSIQWDLFAYLLVSWIIVYFCVWKGIKWTSKVVYFTATFPLIMLIVLFIRGITLEGAGEGLIYYLRPNITKLQNPQVWADAATQVFYSYSLCNGIMVTMGSYNTYHHNLYRDTILLSFLNSGTSLFAGFSVFSVLGFMAKEQNTTIEAVADSGPGLIFITYPRAIALLPLPQLWGVLFFLTIFFLGLDSEFIGQESLIAALVDMKPKFFTKPWRRELLVAMICTAQFFFGILMVTQGGVYIFNMYDNYAAAGWCLFFIGICETLTVSWLCEPGRFWKHVCHMLGFKPRIPFFKYAWAYSTPILTSAIFVYSLIQYQPLKYNDYTYPLWAQFISWCLALCAIQWIPSYAIYKLFTAKGNLFDRWKTVTAVPDSVEKTLQTKNKLFGISDESIVPLNDFGNKQEKDV